MLDKNSPIPVYYQLEERLKESIEKKELKEGDMIPSERVLSEQYGISRMTVRQAINNLVRDGYLYREKGKGTFVASNKIEQPLQGLTSFTEDMRSRGLKPEARLLNFSVEPAQGKLVQKLRLTEGESVSVIKRVRLADDLPMALETTFLPVRLVPGLTETQAYGSIYEYIENQLGLKIEHATQTLEASVARERESEVLQIKKGSPVLLIERTSYLSDQRPLELVKSVYRGDRYKFNVQLHRS
ncbi:GntR family transcriptional regulator [Melghirimyces profundicolus]|uniref:GntR family transcriptional regulator n=1 Tax=Melghirimyces profundicolus TaxID=1242148 RepID=A0A2T6BQX2_9BACL|nr:GntR family transcriptional regulator [Melghirimyces profundicolus]PTX58491.1 GntR family transcriptional regulator [Melghirimyces profundicolus]